MLLLVNQPCTPIVTTRLTLSSLAGSPTASSALGSCSAGSSSISVGKPAGLTPAASWAWARRGLESSSGGRWNR